MLFNSVKLWQQKAEQTINFPPFLNSSFYCSALKKFKEKQCYDILYIFK